MGDATKRPLHIPPWQIPYLEKHRIFELFHELARELVIQQPDDHLVFLKQILYNAARSRNTARVILLGSPKVNCIEVANCLAKITRQIVISDKSLQIYRKGEHHMNAEQKVHCISHLVRKDNAYELGWILVDLIEDEKDAKALLRKGILPTHVIHLIPPFHPSLTELLYCHVPAHWPDFRRKIVGVREVFKKVLLEVFLQERSLHDITVECVQLVTTQDAKFAIKARVLLLGPRGSGRKHQARLLAQNLNLVHVDFERLICEAWMSSSELGKKLRDCKDEVCFHSELLAQVLDKRTLEPDCLEQGWVLTGFPYSRKDMEYLDCIETPPNRVIFLECNLRVCKERLLNRKVNIYTGSVTNLKETTSKDKNLEPHPKDDKEFIDAELSYYCENYGDLRKYCGGTAQCVNADQGQRWVYENILAIITRASPACPPRTPLQGRSTSSLSSTDSCCCCSPIPSKLLDCYVTPL